jgi:2,3-oxidosqualene cyclase
MSSGVDRGIDHLLSQQRDDGCWEGEMVWCTMILSQYIIVKRVTGAEFDPRTTEQMVKYFRVSRTPEGVWGLHPESAGYVFFTTLGYIALRLLGVGPSDPLTATARNWLHAQKGGVAAIPTWGKFWLAMLGLYGYEGVNPVPPEVFLLPKSLPFHPHRYYCHTRLIYLGMSYLYGKRFRADLGPIAAELRDELFAGRFEKIDFAAHRHDVSDTDVYIRPSRWLKASFDGLHVYERVQPGFLRRRALAYCSRRIAAEQRSTQYQALSPVNGLLNCLAMWSENPQSLDAVRSLEAVEKWKWEDDAEGIRYVGALSHTWDTAFAMLALMESPSIAVRHAEVLRSAYSFLRDVQMTSEIPDYLDQSRDPAIGGWCFSSGEHRWPVSDCTSEALCAVIKAHRCRELGLQPSDLISAERLGQAADFILSRQNADGGFGTYERRRGSAWLEAMNPSEMFGQCMTERSYLECTGSAITALAAVRDSLPESRRSTIDAATERAVHFLKKQQRADGSFPGFWGINFTYAIFHVVKALRDAGMPANDDALVRAAEWLRSKQRQDGGWGEHYSGCLEDRYVEHAQSQVVMTSWALLALMEVAGGKDEAVCRGIRWLESVQFPDGSWPQQALNGVFFGSAMLDYRLYKSYFPVWALARHFELTRPKT